MRQHVHARFDAQNFCRQCGAPRKGTAAMAFASAPVASPPTLAPGSSFAEATAEQASPNSSVHLQVLVLLGEKWLWAHGAAELVLLLAKNLKFDYPPGWALAELAMIAVYLLVQILHRSSGSFANRAKSTSSMAFFLGLCGMLVLLAGYLTALQVYVMQVEFAMGLVSMPKTRRKDKGLGVSLSRCCCGSGSFNHSSGP
ncbi:unnamed protein product [Effrenium voratum]|nr:unnamed protein product [Effrenium voratum]